MVHSRVLLNDGSSAVLLNDGTSFVLLNEEGPVHLAPSGGSGGTSKSVGARSLADQQIGERLHRPTLAAITSKLRVTATSESKSQLRIRPLARMEIRLGPFHIPGYSISQIQIQSNDIASARLRYLSFNELRSVLINLPRVRNILVDVPKIQTDLSKMEKRNTRIEKVMRLFSLYNMMESSGQVALVSMERTFDFDETTNDEQLRAFTHSSSFVGNVWFNPEDQSMRILLNGIAYEFCSVPERIFDAFEGADSKGAYFGRNIKGQFNC